MAAVPNVVMYDNAHEGRHLVRFAFCKQHSILDEAITRLRTL